MGKLGSMEGFSQGYSTKGKKKHTIERASASRQGPLKKNNSECHFGEIFKLVYMDKFVFADYVIVK